MDVDEDTEAADTSTENDAISVTDENINVSQNSQNEDIEANNTDSAASSGDLKKEESCSSPTKRKRTSEILGDEGDCQSCPICFDPWTTNGDHRLCALKCGHLFGYNCVNRWLLLNLQDPRCPTCKDKAGVQDIRYIFARKVIAMDDLELTRMKKKLKNVNQEKNRLQTELATTTCQMHMLKQEVNECKRKLAMFNQGPSNCDKSAGEVSLYKDKTLDLGKDSNCRVLDLKNTLNMVAVSMKSTNNLCNGYGVKLINAANFKPTAFILLHAQMIRDIKFHETKPWLMTCSIDKDIKILDVNTNQTNLTLKACSPLWSCCWDIDNEHILYGGQQQGSVLKFDIRKPTEAVQELFVPGDYSPVVSVQAIGSSCSIFPLGGVISCKLTSLWGFENTTQEEPRKHFLPVEGPFVSLTAHRNHNHLFLSSRPNTRYPYARHFLLELTKKDQVGCNIVHTFRGGNTQRMLSRTCLLSNKHDYAAAYIEDQRIVSIWNINNSNWVGSVPAQETVLDINSVKTSHSDFLLTLTESKLRIFKFTNW
ncbi:rfwd3 protein [Holotrichia oblita]|uniref:Rfwd3 protein n=1 Tax=Holotrichia oblita TaxID=644536 RepID=A0ACB9TZ24_HOLOL|nr:rfwd3 protein [Holotrichia oblita]